MMDNVLLLLVCYLSVPCLHCQQETSSLPEYVISECYGDIFSFDCGHGNKIRINKDFFGVSTQRGACSHGDGDCIISNPKSNSLIHRYCTGRRECTYYQVERRGCDGYYSNYQQVEYQCIPDTQVTDICSNVHYRARATYISSPNFPNNYPPNQRCACAVTSRTPGARVRLEIVYMAVKFNKECRDWLRVGRRRMCGTSMDLFSGRRIPVEFSSDRDEGHSGFWLHFHSSVPNDILDIRCGNKSDNLTTTTTTTTTPSTPVSVSPNTATTPTPTSVYTTTGTDPTERPKNQEMVDDQLIENADRTAGKEGRDPDLRPRYADVIPPEQPADDENASDESQPKVPLDSVPRISREQLETQGSLVYQGRTVPPRHQPGRQDPTRTTPAPRFVRRPNHGMDQRVPDRNNDDDSNLEEDMNVQASQDMSSEIRKTQSSASATPPENSGVRRKVTWDDFVDNSALAKNDYIDSKSVGKDVEASAASNSSKHNDEDVELIDRDSPRHKYSEEREGADDDVPAKGPTPSDKNVLTDQGIQHGSQGSDDRDQQPSLNILQSKEKSKDRPLEKQVDSLENPQREPSLVHEKTPRINSGRGLSFEKSIPRPGVSVSANPRRSNPENDVSEDILESTTGMVETGLDDSGPDDKFNKDDTSDVSGVKIIQRDHQGTSLMIDLSKEMSISDDSKTVNSHVYDSNDEPESSDRDIKQSGYRNINKVPGKSPYPMDKISPTNEPIQRPVRPVMDSPLNKLLQPVAGVEYTNSDPTRLVITSPEHKHHQSTSAAPRVTMDQVRPTVMATSGMGPAPGQRRSSDDTKNSDVIIQHMVENSRPNDPDLKQSEGVTAKAEGDGNQPNKEHLESSLTLVPSPVDQSHFFEDGSERGSLSEDNRNLFRNHNTNTIDDEQYNDRTQNKNNVNQDRFPNTDGYIDEDAKEQYLDPNYGVPHSEDLAHDLSPDTQDETLRELISRIESDIIYDEEQPADAQDYDEYKNRDSNDHVSSEDYRHQNQDSPPDVEPLGHNLDSAGDVHDNLNVGLEITERLVPVDKTLLFNHPEGVDSIDVEEITQKASLDEYSDNARNLDKTIFEDDYGRKPSNGIDARFEAANDDDNFDHDDNRNTDKNRYQQENYDRMEKDSMNTNAYELPTLPEVRNVDSKQYERTVTVAVNEEATLERNSNATDMDESVMPHYTTTTDIITSSCSTTNYGSVGLDKGIQTASTSGVASTPGVGPAVGISTTARCTPSGGHGASNGTDDTDSATAIEEGSLVTMGLVILAICIGLGLLFVFVILLAVYCRRRRQRNEETQTPSATTTRNGSANSGSTNTDSARDLLTSSLGIRIGNGYRKGAGHQTRLTYDAPFVGLCKTDKFCQVDLDFPHQNRPKLPLAARMPLSGSEHSSIYCSPPTGARSNSKGVQVGNRNLDRHDRKLSYNYAKPKRGRTIKQKALDPEPASTSYDAPQNPYEFYSNVTICPVECYTRDIYSSIDPAQVHSAPPTRSRQPEPPVATFYLNPDPVTCSVSTSVTRPEGMKQRSLASMPEMSELVIEPESTYAPHIPDFISDDSDWETKSAISL